MSKSKHTQRCYHNANNDQKKLDRFSFFACTVVCIPRSSKSGTEHAVINSEGVTIRQESVEVEIPPAIREESVEVQIPPAICEECVEVVIPPALGSDQDDKNRWEYDVDECVHGGKVDVHGWEVLQEQIKKDMKKTGNTLPITQINQLLILQNFATLQLKGYGKIKASFEIAQQWHEGEGKHYAHKAQALAWHYQVFEQLPSEKRGGEKMACSLLLDECIKTAAQSWLTSQQVSQVTPHHFQHALNKEILPALSVSLKQLLCEQTAW